MNNDLETTIEECRKRVNQGASSEDIVLYLHDRGITITESMKVLKEIYNLPLGKAKELVTAHPIWANQVRNADILHEELEKSLQNKDVNC